VTRSGAEYIAGLRDGRQVYIDGELVSDVTRHPAFKGAVRSVAALYDTVNDPANRGELTFTSPATAEPVSLAYLIPRSAADLSRRRVALKRMAEETYGLMGRGPEHVAGFLSGFAARSDVFAAGGQKFGDNVERFHAKARDEDLYLTYTILPPQIDRTKPAHQQADPTLYAGVVEEREDGVVISGAQMLGTGTAISDYVYLSSISPLVPGDEAYAMAAMIPVGAPGVKVYARRSYAAATSSLFDYPVSARFDESDSLLVYDKVFVPWENLFAYRNIDVVKKQWFATPGHLFGNNQAQIRFWTKLEFMVGLAHRVAEMNGSVNIPPVKGVLGEMASMVATVSGLVLAQEQHSTIDDHGIAWPGRAECFAVMTMQPELYGKLLTMIRDLCGGGLIQLPSSVNDFANPAIAADLDRFIQSPGVPSTERVKLLKLVWDMVGSEFASRHHQYEMFYAGAPFVVKMRMYEAYDFTNGNSLVDKMLSSYDLGGLRDDPVPVAEPELDAARS
jgi:4-hydroxyphenylacetate 3-monooxygenase